MLGMTLRPQFATLVASVPLMVNRSPSLDHGGLKNPPVGALLGGAPEEQNISSKRGLVADR